MKFFVGILCFLGAVNNACAGFVVYERPTKAWKGTVESIDLQKTFLTQIHGALWKLYITTKSGHVISDHFSDENLAVETLAALKAGKSIDVSACAESEGLSSADEARLKLSTQSWNFVRIEWCSIKEKTPVFDTALLRSKFQYFAEIAYKTHPILRPVEVHICDVNTPCVHWQSGIVPHTSAE